MTELLIVVVIIVVLAALVFPLGRKIVQKGKTATAVSNVRQIGMVTQEYVSESNGFLPNDLFARSDTWIVVLWNLAYPDQRGPSFTPDRAGQVMKGTIFHTPLQERISVNGKPSRCFAWNGHLRSHCGHPKPRASRIKQPERTILLSDTTDSSRILASNNQINYRNDGQAIFLFADGTVRLLGPGQVPTSPESVFWGGDGGE